MRAEISVEPVANGRFKFSCHKNLSCFTVCCANLNLVLTPYDVIRMKKRLNLSSDDFLKRYAQCHINDHSGLPVVQLRMNPDAKRICPFVSAGGCQIYEDRPGACRIYPLGRAASKICEEKKSAEYYFLIRESHCLGFNENRQWQVQDWVEDQNLNEYNTMNEHFMDIATGKKSQFIKTLSQPQLQMFYMSCYNLDTFRKFIFESTFLKRFEMDQDQIHRIRTDDVELMQFGCRWLRFALFGENTLTVK